VYNPELSDMFKGWSPQEIDDFLDKVAELGEDQGDDKLSL